MYIVPVSSVVIEEIENKAIMTTMAFTLVIAVMCYITVCLYYISFIVFCLTKKFSSM